MSATDRMTWGMLFVALLAFGCDGGTRLFVDLKTDHLPGAEFTEITTEVLHTGGGESVVMAAGQMQDYLAGQRVAEVSGLDLGEVTVRVFLRQADGSILAERSTVVDIRGDAGLTVVIARSCQSVACPLAAEPDATECFGGRCVDPACSPENPDACGPLDCRIDGDCAPPAAACANERCIDGACLAAVDDALCGAGERCSPELGCVLDTTGIDAGTDASLDAADAADAADAGGCGSLSFDEFEAAVEDAFCATFLGPEADLNSFAVFFRNIGPVFGDPTECDRVFEAANATGLVRLGAVRDAIARGTVVFDPARAAECTCGGFPTLLVAASATRGFDCGGVFGGTLSDGDPCRLHEECPAGSYCQQSGACGICVPQAPTGSPCDHPDGCASTVEGEIASCEGTLGVDSTCSAGRTVRGAELGGSCGVVDVIGVTEVRYCEPGLFCEPGVDMTDGTCTAPLALGDPCTLGCPVGLHCDGGACRQLRVEESTGAPCGTSGDEFVACAQTLGLECMSDVCECADPPCNATPRGDGRSCGGFLACASGFHCESGDCVPNRTTGSACSRGAQCEIGSCTAGLCDAEYCGAPFPP